MARRDHRGVVRPDLWEEDLPHPWGEAHQTHPEGVHPGHREDDHRTHREGVRQDHPGEDRGTRRGVVHPVRREGERPDRRGVAHQVPRAALAAGAAVPPERVVVAARPQER